MTRGGTGELSALCSDPESKNRLLDYSWSLSIGSDECVEDDKAEEVLGNYLWPWSRKKVARELSYLRSLSDPSGKRYCRTMWNFDGMMPRLSLFMQPDVPSFVWNRNFRRALKRVVERYPKHLKMAVWKTDADVKSALSDWSTSAGFEGIKTGLRKKREYLQGILSELCRKEDEAIKNGRYQDPMMLGRRSGVKGEFTPDGKPTGTCEHTSRPVMMVSLWQILTEARIAVALEGFLRFYEGTAIGKSDQMITDEVNRLRLTSAAYVSLDNSKYDSTLPEWLLHAAFDVLEQCFDFRDQREKDLFRVVRMSYIYKTLILPDGPVSVKKGTPSGSRLTSLINGICNELITETWLSAFNRRAKFIIMGDDNLICLTETENNISQLVRDVSSYVEHNFGMKIHPDKSNCGTWDEDPEFMSRTWGVLGPYRPEHEVISKIAYPETRRPYWKESVTPELIIYSYILGYAQTMRSLMDVDRFLRENNPRILEALSDKDVCRELPWSLRTYAATLFPTHCSGEYGLSA